MTTKEALLASIDKWDKICFEGGEDKGSLNCELCQKYWKVLTRCGECPINLVSGGDGCEGTPYVETPCLVYDEEDFDAALQEYFFLCMLYHEYYGD